MNYKAALVAKAIAAAITGLGTIGASFAQALSDGTITGDEWGLIITVITGAAVAVLAVFYVPNQPADGDK